MYAYVTYGSDNFLEPSCDLDAMMLAEHVRLNIPLCQFLVAERTRRPLLHALQNCLPMLCVSLSLALANGVFVTMVVRRVARPHPIWMEFSISLVLVHR